MNITTSWPIAVVSFVLLCIGNTHAFAPELPFQHGHGRLTITVQSIFHQGSAAAGDDYTTTCNTSTSTSPSSPSPSSCRHTIRNKQPLSRRIFTTRATSALVFLILTPEQVTAGIDMTPLKTAPIEGDATGAASRIKQLQQQTHTIAKRDGTVYLDSGVSYTESNTGSVPGGRNRAIRNGVQNRFNVAADLRISTLGGLTIYSTRDDNQSNELSWKVGSGDFPKGAEEGMMGMRLGSVRRIEVPSDFIFAARNVGTLPEIKTKVGRERFEELVRTGDARLVFDVRVTGINPGDGRI
mmetsp:Transcript_50825/g.57550  ORF Transcript_50825/g.57550 Transcript_50825/m.57550 type:complete len:296 (-) Transcript_50825:43-930(-)